MKQQNPKLTITLGVHNHQPVGNFDFVFKESVEKCYRPLTDAILRHEKVKWNIHFSGPLLLWLADNEPQLIEDIRTLVKRGQVEILGSGLSEPILCSLPTRDVATQLEEMQQLLMRLFGVRARGIWLTERIWEPYLPMVLQPLGVEYVVVDDYHFFYSGMKHEQLDGYYTVEKHGHAMKVFPISEQLRYRIPFKAAGEFVDELQQWAYQPGLHGRPRVLNYFDDGEKFGVWPGTYEWVYDKGWLDKFLAGLETNTATLETALLGDIADRQPASGRASLPTASYREMMEWALPPVSARKQENLYEQIEKLVEPEFMRGGYWDQFLVKYEESNRLHKRMLYTSERLDEVQDLIETKEQGEIIEQARHHMHMAQCNDVYWHGLFGGLYLPFLRAAIHEELMKADQLLDSIEPDYFAVDEDFNRDGSSDVMIRTEDQFMVLSPTFDGGVYLWDDHHLKHSYSDVLTRREETYHNKITEAGDDAESEEPKSIHDIMVSKEKNLHEYLIYDNSLRVTGRTFLYTGDPAASDVRRNDFPLCGDLHTAAWEAESITSTDNGYRAVIVTRGFETGHGSADLIKTWDVPETGVGYTLNLRMENLEEPHNISSETMIAVEVNLTLNALDEFRYVSIGDGEKVGLSAHNETPSGESVLVVDKYRNMWMDVRASKAARIMMYPVETVSVSESGFERNYQGTCLVFAVPLAQLAAAEGFSISIERFLDE